MRVDLVVALLVTSMEPSVWTDGDAMDVVVVVTYIGLLQWSHRLRRRNRTRDWADSALSMEPSPRARRKHLDRQMWWPTIAPARIS